MVAKCILRWWKLVGCFLVAWHLFYIISWHSDQPSNNDNEFFNLPLKDQPNKISRKNITIAHEDTSLLGLHEQQYSSNKTTKNHTINITPSSDKPHLVLCTKTEEYLLPIAKYFTIHRLFDGFNGVPPWNATVLLLVDNQHCADHPYVKESIQRRLNSSFVNESEKLFNGKWKHGVFWPSTKNHTRIIHNRPALMRARGEVFWRNSDTNCNDVDFVWDRHVENPSQSCFTIHYLQGVSAAYSRDYPYGDKGELGWKDTAAIYEGRAVHPLRPRDMNYTNFCSFLIRWDPNDLVDMFKTKNYDVDAIVRHMFFKQLSEYKPCTRVVECPGNPHTAYKCFEGYKFHITMENSLVDGYVSEKIFNGALGGGIPIYFGASDIGSYVNSKSIVHCNVSRSVIGEMRTFYPRGAPKDKRTFKLNNVSAWPTEEELLKWADGNLRKEIQPCIQKVIELDENDTAYREVIDEPFITNHDIMDGLYPWRGIKLAFEALASHGPGLKFQSGQTILDTIYNLNNIDNNTDQNATGA